MNNFKNILTAGAIVAIIASAALIYFVINRTNTTELANSNAAIENANIEPTPKPIPTPTQALETAGDFSYKLVFPNENDYPMDDNTFDGQVVRIDNKTKKEEVLISSIKSAYPALKKQFNLKLQRLSFPTDAKNLYFNIILSETDSGPFDIIRLNLATKVFSKLKISSYYQGFNPKAAMANGTLAVSTYNPAAESDEQSMFILNLETDTAKLLTKLPAGQSFNQCADSNCFGGFQGEVKWLNSTSVQAAIYNVNQTTQDEYNNVVRKLIQKKTYPIN